MIDPADLDRHYRARQVDRVDRAPVCVSDESGERGGDRADESADDGSRLLRDGAIMEVEGIMVDGTRFELFAILVDQAERVRAEYPELFSYLRERDDLLRRIAHRIPDPGDPEGWVGFDVQDQVVASLRRIPPGMADLT